MRQDGPSTRFHYAPITDLNVRDGCYLTSMGHTRHAPGLVYPPSGHPEQYAFDANTGRVFSDFGLVLITRGRGFFEAEGEPAVEVEAGAFFCLTPSRWHRYAPDPKTGWEEYWLCFNGDYPHRLQMNGELPRRSVAVRPAGLATYRRRLLHILEALDSQEMATTLGMGLRGLALFAEISAEAKEPPEDDAGKMEPSICSGAMRYIRENLHRPINMSQLAAQYGVTRRTLERHFRMEAGFSPGEYVIRSRVERARGLIEGTEMPMKSVAYACGFSSPQQMIYDFHRQTGMAPGRFRVAAGR